MVKLTRIKEHKVKGKNWISESVLILSLEDAKKIMADV